MNNSELHRSSAAPGIDERLADLEVRLSFQEDSLQALSQQMASLQQLAEQQQRMLQTVYRQLCELREGGPDDTSAPDQERPPHY